MEIYFGEILLAKHKAQYRSGNIIYLHGQYEGLDEFDFSFHPSIDKRHIDELATLAFAEKLRILFSLGRPALAKPISLSVLRWRR